MSNQIYKDLIQSDDYLIDVCKKLHSVNGLIKKNPPPPQPPTPPKTITVY